MRIMLHGALAIICGMALSVPARAGELPFTLTINVSKERIVSGQDIALSLTFDNLSGSPRFLVRNADSNWIVVRRADGSAVALTEYGRSLYHPESPVHSICLSGCTHFTLIPTGKSGIDTATLNKIYDMSAPGTYTVQVEHQLRPIESGPARIAGPLPGPTPSDEEAASLPAVVTSMPDKNSESVPLAGIIRSNVLTITVTE